MADSQNKPKLSSAETLKSELSKELAQLQAAYDAEMASFFDLLRRISVAEKQGADAASLELKLAVVQRDRRAIGDEISLKLQEIRDVDSPTLEEEYAAHLAELANAAEKNAAPKRKLTYEESLARAKARGKTVAADADDGAEQPKSKGFKQAPDQLPMLPWWEETARRAPNLLLRNALFGIAQERQFFGEMKLLASLDGHTVKATQTLNQYDLDTLEMLLHIQREHAVGKRVNFTAHAFLKALGRGVSGDDYKDLHKDLIRLATATVEIRWENERKSFVGSLVGSIARNEETETYSLQFNEDMVQLYDAGSTQFSWAQRKQLGRNNLAKYLQVFYASHEAPFPMKIQTLRSLSGSTSPLKEFKRMLKTALDKLQSVGFLSGWSIEDDLVTVKKTPPPPSKKKQKAVENAV